MVARALDSSFGLNAWMLYANALDPYAADAAQQGQQGQLPPALDPYSAYYDFGQTYERGPKGAQNGMEQLARMLGMNPEDMMAMLIDYLLNYQQQNAPQNRGSMSSGNFARGGNVSPASWGGGSGGGGGGGGGGSTRAASQDASLPKNVPTGHGTVGDFLQAALAQKGDRYVFGAETKMNDNNPNTFDCSELVQWAAAQAGINLVDGSQNQRAAVKHISVEEAMRTPGALLFTDGHVAISLGDGRTIEAANSRDGVCIKNAQGRFIDAGIIPGLNYG